LSAFNDASWSRNPDRRIPFASQNSINKTFHRLHNLKLLFIGVWCIPGEIHDALFKTASIVIWHSANPSISF
jgi:hypothetical protein